MVFSSTPFGEAYFFSSLEVFSQLTLETVEDAAYVGLACGLWGFSAKLMHCMAWVQRDVAEVFGGGVYAIEVERTRKVCRGGV